jgi:transcriptional regulator with XRE-family HTH domain
MEPEVNTERITAELMRQRYRHHHAAAALGLDRASFSRKLRGERKFTLTEITTLADWLDVPVVEFLPSRRRVRVAS